MRKKLLEFLSARVRTTSRSRPITHKFSNPEFCIHLKHTTTNIANRQVDQELLQVLQSEIAHEKSNGQNFEKSRQQNLENVRKGLLGPFVVDSDPPDSKDVILRVSYGREKIAITALLDSNDYESGDEICPRKVLFKVCIAKPGVVASILQIDCYSEGYGNGYGLKRLSLHESPLPLRPSNYRGRSFRTFGTYDLEKAFKEFLEARGINIDVTNFLIIHLHNKEQQQYVQWLHYLESIIKKGLETRRVTSLQS